MIGFKSFVNFLGAEDIPNGRQMYMYVLPWNLNFKNLKYFLFMPTVR